MNKKQEMNLEIVSKIDDEIIEKNTRKRASLLAGKGKRNNKRLVLLLVAVITLVAIMIPLFIVLFSKQVPIYEGMSVLSNYQPSKDTASSGGVTTLLAGGSGRTQIDFLNDDNGNHYGQNKKPVEDIVEDDSSISLTVSDQQMYYAEPNQDIYINIHFSNPDDFVILSFVFNGKTYSSYMFEEGSDMENIIIKCSIGDVEGIVEYTIDAIKYVDGTAIKDVVMAGDKTIKVGVYSAGKQPTAQITDELIGINDISFAASINDRLDLIRMSGGEAFAVLCDDDTVIAQQKLTVGENNVKFEGLTKDTTYRYAIIASYDSLDGTGFNTYVIYEKEITTKKIVAFDSVIIGQESISFGLVWEESFENKVLQSLTLYKGEEIIQELDVKATSISGLLSNNEYRLVATYTNKGKTETSDMTFTTKAKATPEIIITESSKTQTSLGFDISVTDVDNVGTITKLDLIHGEDVQNITDLNTREFTDLLSDNTYTVKVTYTYDLNDGVGSQTTVKTLDITTEVKAEPIFTFKNMASEMYSISGEYDITNVDNTLLSYTVKLFKGEELVSEHTDKKIDFASLDDYTDYTVKIIYTFDVNDGKGVQEKAAEYAIKTLPYIDVTECKIANTSAIVEGDTIIMQVELDNPRNMSVESVVVNGETYNVTGTSTANKIFVEIVYNDQFAGGDTYLKIDRLNAKIDGTTFTTEPETELSDNVFINGKLEVLKIEYVNESFEPIDWAFPSETVYLLITLDNPTGYTVDNIYHYGTPISDIIKVDNNHLYYAISALDYGWNTHTLSRITYHNEYVEKTLTYSNISAFCYKVASDDTVYISKPDDLKNMNDGYYYELSGDIDLSDLEWIGNEFNGVFDGKEYSIQNMSFVGTLKNTTAYIGLFATASGVIENLNIKEATIIAEITSDDGNNYPVYCGSIIGQSYRSIIRNCTVDSDSIITVKNNTSEQTIVGGLTGLIAGNIINCTNNGNITATCTNTDSSTGGLVGRIDNGAIVNCHNSGSVTATGENGNAGGVAGDDCGTITNCTNSGSVNATDVAGGLAGRVDSGTITNCTNSGNVTATYSVGGLAGYVGDGGTITNCTNSGNVTSTSGYAGGVAGEAWSGAITNCSNSGSVTSTDGRAGGVAGEILAGVTITNCTNSGNVTATGEYGSAGGVAGYLSDGTITNSYSLVTGTDGHDGNLCTVEQLNSKEFYTETLGWSEEIWDFSDLDVENGKYPKLKK